MTAKDTCTGKHAEHICELAKAGKLAQIRELTKEVRFLCTKCGRAAAQPDSLCKPVDLNLIESAVRISGV